MMTHLRLSMVDWRNGLAIVTGSLLVVMVGCAVEPAEDSIPSAAPVMRTAQEGPVQLTLSVVPAELPFDQKARLTVEAVADKDTSVELGDYQVAVADTGHQFEFRLRKLTQAVAAPGPEGKLRWAQQYEIEFFLPGEYELPPARLKYAGAVSSADPKELATETIKIVASPTEAAQLPADELKKIEVLPPVELKEPWSWWWVAVIPLGLVAAGALFMLVRRRAGEAADVPEIIPAHEWARRRIAALVADDLISKGEVQEFYYRISAIVRGYIERRFGVSAPEMTTEEFLTEIASDIRFAGGPAAELQPFLIACDLVKYARQRPAAGEWNHILRTATDYVERTRVRSQEEMHENPAFQEEAAS